MPLKFRADNEEIGRIRFLNMDMHRNEKKQKSVLFKCLGTPCLPCEAV